MNIRKPVTIAAFLSFAFWGFVPAVAQQSYVGDPDPKQPNLHVQPPSLSPDQKTQGTVMASSVINGITYVDALLSAGYDLAGYDLGNEPAITANPLDPNQIVLTSFSGSNWGIGGEASLFYSSDGGANWGYYLSIPRPPGAPTNINCPCDQTVDWGRNGLLYGTFLHVNTGSTVYTVFSAQAAVPANLASWVYRAPGGVAQSTNLPSLIHPDQPWLWSGPLPEDNSQTNVCVAYDNLDGANAEMRAADSPGASPLDFTRDRPTNSDSLQYSDSMNPGNRIAVGPDGTIFNLYQRLVSVQPNGVKQLTYLINVSTDGGQTWSVANSDHVSGAKIVAANVYSFQGNGSKVAGVNALLGGVDAITVDPKTGAAWVVYGARATLTSHDQLFRVKVTYSSGNLTVGTPSVLTSSTIDNYLPSVAVLPNGELGVLFLTVNGSTFAWRFAQYTNGITIAKTTAFPSFTSPFNDNGVTNQRIFGDYVQVRAVGCSFYGAFPARGAGVDSAFSIDPYFMSAPAATTCALPTLTTLVPSATCSGSPGFDLTIGGGGFANGATGRIRGTLRPTTYNSPTQVTMAVQAADVVVPGTATVNLLGAAPAGGLSGDLPFAVLATPAAPTASNNGPICEGATLQLSASTIAGATYSWTGPLGFTSAQQNPSIANALVTNAGLYSVTVTVGGCTSTAATTTPTIIASGGACNDGNVCTSGETCGSGLCTGTPIDGQACDDGNVCTTGDVCLGGSCLPGAGSLDCNDGNLCTTDSCNPTTGCVHVNNTNACDDGDACTVNDGCGASTCQGTPIICNDSNACTDDSCNPATGACVYANDDTNTCSDGNLCTQTDVCHNGICEGSNPLECTGGCSPGFLQVGGLCRKTYDIDGSLLDNLNAFCDGTGTDRYNDCNFQNYGFHWTDLGRTLAAITRIDVELESGVNCGGSSSSVTLNGAYVGSFNLVENCVCPSPHGTISLPNLGTGAYVMAGLNAISITPSGDCEGLSKSANLGNSFARVTVTYSPYSVACQLGACVPATGACSFSNLQDGTACSDDNACTSGDSCGAGSCLPGAPIVCNDANACTADSCDSTLGCVYSNNANACDDGNACTSSDTCLGGNCAGTAVPAPTETGGVTVERSGSDATIVWTLATDATASDVLRGDIASLPVGAGGGDEVCLGSTGATTMTDAFVPAAGSGVWYLIRGKNACAGNGTYGNEGSHGLPAAPRVSTTCP